MYFKITKTNDIHGACASSEWLVWVLGLEKNFSVNNMLFGVYLCVRAGERLRVGREVGGGLKAGTTAFRMRFYYEHCALHMKRMLMMIVFCL